MRKWIWAVIIVIIVLLGSGAAWFLAKPGTAATGTAASGGAGSQDYELATAKRANLESIVSSSGALSAVSTVSILSQMSGRAEKVNVRYNDHVKKGQVLAELNTDMLRVQEKQSSAAVRKAQATYDLQLLDVQNKRQLAAKALISEYDLKTSETTLEADAADLAAAQAALEVIENQLNQYALITSPIDGIVIDRAVDVGQSVLDGSSPNAGSLFTIAGDLSTMEIKAEVDELDIGSIRAGQSVRFTVEAYPNAGFAGTVREIRLVPKKQDNVVSYYVMVDARNKNGKLLPGMTAEVQFIAESRQNVLTVPNAALRFQPTGLPQAELQDMVSEAALAALPADQREEARKAMEQARQAASKGAAPPKATGLSGMMMAGPPPGMGAGNDDALGALPGGQDMKQLWYVGAQSKLAVRIVKVGATNGSSTEIIGADDLEGARIIVRARVE
jgi:HlyD family secretion protein